MSDHGNLSALRRRAGDRAPGAARALLWAERASDILLLPHSPLALANVLSHPEGRFDLLACESPDPASRFPTVDAPVDAPVGAPGVPSIAAARSRHRRARASSNLLTRHAPDALRERARSAVVESALVRRRDERRLYLVAGFLRAEGLDAPILLYPALLLPPRGTIGPQLRIEDTVPDQNRQAIAHCRIAHGIDLPALGSHEPLSDYFARLGAAVAPVPGLELVYEVGIGNADADFLCDPADGDALPAIPADLDTSLAMALASELSLDQLQRVLQLLPASRRPVPDTAAARTSEDEAADTLRDYAVKLASRGLDRVAFGQLAELPERIDRWLDLIGRARRSRTVAALFTHHVFTVRQLARLGGIIELVDKAPPAIESARHADLAYESTAQLLRRARHQAQLIEEEFEALKSVFVLEKVPGKSDLLRLMDELGGAHGELAVVDQDYFHARRQFTEFCVEKPAALDEEHRRRLVQLVKVLRFRELFVNNTEYRRALGTGYRGLRTDWKALAGVVDYAREVATVLGSEALAATAVSDFAVFRRALIGDLDVLRGATDALDEAVGTIGREWQTRTVDALLLQLGETAERLRDWRQRFDDPTHHGRLTAARVLSSVGGRIGDAASERQLRIARERIEQSLRREGGDADRIARTLDWLRLASLTATERQLDVTVIVDRLQIA